MGRLKRLILAVLTLICVAGLVISGPHFSHFSRDTGVRAAGVAWAADEGSTDTGATAGGSDSTSDTDESESAGGDESDGLLRRILSAIDNLVQTMQDLISGDLLYRKFVEWVSRIMDEWLRPVENVFDRNFLQTPSLTAVPGVHSLWSTAVWFSLGLIALALVLFAARAVQCSDYHLVLENGKVLVVAALGGLASLWICEFAISLQNRIWADVINHLMVAAGAVPGQDGASMLPLRLIFGATGNAAQDQGLRLVDIFGAVGDPVAAAVADAAVVGSVLFIVIGALTVGILAALLLAKFIFLVGLAITGPLYLAGGAVVGRMEPVVGWAALYLRTLLVQSVCCLFWFFMVEIQLLMGPGTNGDLQKIVGVGAFLINLLLLFLLIYVVLRFWLSPAWAAVRHAPLTLNGAAVTAHADDLSRKIRSGLADFYDRRFSGRRESRWSGGQPGPSAAEGRYDDPVPRGMPVNAVTSTEPAPSEVLSRVVKVHPASSAPSTSKDLVTLEVVRGPDGDPGRYAREAASFLASHGWEPSSVRLSDDKPTHVLVSATHQKEIMKDLERWVGRKVPYWQEGNHYITFSGGVKVLHPEPPDGIPMGRWDRQG